MHISNSGWPRGLQGKAQGTFIVMDTLAVLISGIGTSRPRDLFIYPHFSEEGEVDGGMNAFDL